MIFAADSEAIFASVIAALAIIAVSMNPVAIVSLSLVIDPAWSLAAARYPVVILLASRDPILALVIAASAIIAVLMTELSIVVVPVMWMRLPSIRIVSGEMLICAITSPCVTRKLMSVASTLICDCRLDSASATVSVSACTPLFAVFASVYALSARVRA